jgi:murein DD-endopeptidase MepM/ murein hydrolase activator NlpD
MHLPVIGNHLVIRGKKFNNAFGMVRTHSNGTAKAHQGWDISATPGTPVFAVANGVIEFVTGDGGDYGRQICLSFNFKGRTLYAFYAHLQEITVVKGQFVAEGEDIGLVGRTGNAKNLPMSQSHLHFEIRTSPKPPGGLNGRLEPSTIFGAQPLLDIIFDDFPIIY